MAIWNLSEDAPMTKFVVENYERVIVTPFATSAEMQAKMFAEMLHRIVEAYKEQETAEYKASYFPAAQIAGATVHETETGYATYMLKDNNEKLPRTNFPIRVFTPDQSEMVIADQGAIWLSSQIVLEMKN